MKNKRILILGTESYLETSSAFNVKLIIDYC